MQVEVNGRNIAITTSIKNAVENSLSRLNKYSRFIKDEAIAKIDIEHYSDNTFRITVYIPLINHNYLHCKEQNHDLYIGIKNIVKPLESQLRKLKVVVDKKGAISTSEAMEIHVEDDPNIIIDVEE